MDPKSMVGGPKRFQGLGYEVTSFGLKKPIHVSDRSPSFLIARNWGHSNTNDIKNILNVQFTNFYPFQMLS